MWLFFVRYCLVDEDESFEEFWYDYFQLVSILCWFFKGGYNSEELESMPLPKLLTIQDHMEYINDQLNKEYKRQQRKGK